MYSKQYSTFKVKEGGRVIACLSECSDARVKVRTKTGDEGTVEMIDGRKTKREQNNWACKGDQVCSSTVRARSDVSF